MSIPEPGPALAVEMRGIVKRFPGLVANDQVDFDLRAGEVHALLGENGAGKSTLMNILAGLYQADAGTVAVDGRPVRIASPSDAIAAGVGMVHQHFTLVPSLTVTENILLGLPVPRFRLDLRRQDARMRAFADEVGLRVDPSARVWQLSVGEQQRVEILKMLYRGARILIMDEPTAVLAPQEADELFRTLRSMVARGGSVVLISHKLDEVLRIADRITVMRRGRVSASGFSAVGRTRPELARLMVGRDVLETIQRPPARIGDVVLVIHDLRADNDKGLPALRGVDLEVREGEILGVAGVVGNGQSELAEAITGMRTCIGSVTVDGREVANRPTLEAIRAHVASVPEDRLGAGSAPDLSLTDNLIMKRFRDAPVSHHWVIDRRAANRLAEALKTDYQVAAPSIRTRARLLSGGNLQRLILAREITSEPRLIVAVQPTRGLDVGAIETVHRLLLEQRAAGTAILLVSEDLDEILAIADRVAVLFEGRVAGTVDAADADIHELGLWMTGGADTPESIPASAQPAGTAT